MPCQIFRRQPTRPRLETLEGRRLLAVVSIDTGDFAGFYDVTGEGRFTGDQSFDLDPGQYQMKVLGTASFNFEVDAAGGVSSLNPNAASGGPNTLMLNNETMSVDPGNFEGFFDLVDRLSGQQDYVLVPGLDNYQIKVQGTAGFSFDLDATGNVVSNNLAAATGFGNTLTFQTTTVNVDPVGFVGVYDLVDRLSGPQSYALLPGIGNYQVKVQGTSRFSFNIDASGNVVSNNTVAATGSGDTLTFANTQIAVDPGAYLGYYDLVGRLTGVQQYTLVPGIDDYQVKVAGLGRVGFDVDANGNVSSDNPNAALASGSTLVFQTSPIKVDPAGYTGDYFLTGLTTASGIQVFDLPAGLDGYRLNAGAMANTFSVDALGDPQPSVLLYTIGGQNYDFLLQQFIPEPPLTQVEIDVKPGSEENPLNVASNGVVAVAILTTDDFAAADVEVSSVVFAGATVDHSSFEDVDGDGDLDLLLHFRTNETNLEQLYEDLIADDLDEDGILDSTNQVAEISLTGQTTDETLIEGSDEMDLFLRGRSLRELVDELFGG